MAMALQLHASPLDLQAGPLKYHNLSVALLMCYCCYTPLPGKAPQQSAHMWGPSSVAFCSVYFRTTSAIVQGGIVATQLEKLV